MENPRRLRWRIAMDLYSKVETEAGNFWIGCNPDGITMICSARQGRAAFEDLYRRRFGVKPQPGNIPESFIRALRNAAAGRPFEEVPIDLSGLTEFQQKVLRVLRQVPRGEVQTYAWLARRSGRPKAARAVGNTMARNPVPILIPCHRAVPAAGGIGNYGLGKAMKRELLSREGVAVDEL
jgi:methylated-DNA-[protein]-cysteine S-methyltransferase